MARKKAANGEGSIYKVTTKAGLRHRVALADAQGRRVVQQFKTEKEALAARKEGITALDAGRPIKNDRHTLGELFDAWLDTLKVVFVLAGQRRQVLGELFDAWLDTLKAQVDRGERSFNTLREYESYVRQHLKPALGSLDCRQPSVMEAEVFFAGLTLAPKTRHNIRIALRRALNVVLKWEWVDRNVVKQTDPIPVQQPRVTAINIADGERLLTALQDHPLWSVFATALYTGLRAGELAGLAVEHADLSTGTLRVCQQVQRVPGKGLVLKALKTQASNATVPLLPDAVRILREAIGERTNGLIWRTKTIRPYDPVHITHRFQSACKAAGLPVIPLHHLRH